MTPSPRLAPLVGGLLVGGGSRRFGRAKALEPLDGTSFAERAVAALRQVVGEVVLLGGGPVPEALAGLERLPDAPGADGPLAGILAGLSARRDRAWLIAACDQPFLTRGLLEWLITRREPGQIAVLPRLVSGGLEPFPAVYEPGALGVLSGLAIDEGSIQPLAGRCDVLTPTPPRELARALRDVDTEADLGRG
ncbi:MAG TPA: molybdenum cofactor guanylyltransferase [Thermoanaerobaculia bacterium]|nr:molybdenum cofactor guanylyltransferase [Thermoanaerobaculia bacterium]